MIKIAPSLLAADFLKIGAEIESVRESGADWLHFDVMDGMFVPNITFGQGLLKACSSTGIFCDAHLMIDAPERYITSFAEAGARCITVHAEATTHLHRTLTQIRENGCLAGVALNVATNPDVLEYVLEEVDLVLVMLVNPGFGGQKLVPACLRKVEKVRAMLDNIGSKACLQVDGGVSVETAGQCISAGADVLVTGSAFFKAADRRGFVNAIRARE